MFSYPLFSFCDFCVRRFLKLPSGFRRFLHNHSILCLLLQFISIRRENLLFCCFCCLSDVVSGSRRDTENVCSRYEADRIEQENGRNVQLSSIRTDYNRRSTEKTSEGLSYEDHPVSNQDLSDHDSAASADRGVFLYVYPLGHAHGAQKLYIGKHAEDPGVERAEHRLEIIGHG